MLRRTLLSLLAGVSVAALACVPAFAQSDETNTLRLMTFGGEAQLKATQDAVTRFNEKYPNVAVEVGIDPVGGGWGDFVSRVLQQYNAGEQYDIYHTATETLQSFAARNMFLPLDDFIAAHDTFDDFDQRLFELTAYKGKSYFIPSTWNNIMVNYNRALFEAAEVPFPTKEWTWEEFANAAQKLTVRDANGNVSQFGYEVPSFFFGLMPWFFSNDTSPITADWTASNMTDPKVKETLEYLYSLIHEYKVSPVPGQEGIENQFFAGQIAMISRGHWIVQNAVSSKLDMDVAVQPAKVNHNTVIGFGAYGISSKTTKAELAEALVLELLSPETQQAEGELGGAVPGRKSAAETAGFLAFPPSAQLYYETLPDTLAVPSPANFQEVDQIVMRYFTAMMAGEVTIDEGIAQADLELKRSFQRIARITQ
ncbi:sugar ABC transporter substrate-binding protein [Devosia epidermidihirudinis]|uniref:Sugar ABC transporter substrate-binding protein n=1 Tax=Devosia epidermidihirudinis TaxID=1293439 RepID=A0A0F5QDG9_9HYPH|nr:sugar ABC transporter substrate-binding protein [Devosia epidermidihirudinis]KKC38763.1 sugar ABC transporter substrate-binding protein [Devosia epidermidihirudinis]